MWWLRSKLVYDIADSPLLKGGLFLAFYWYLWFARAPGRRREVAGALTAAVIVAQSTKSIT